VVEHNVARSADPNGTPSGAERGLHADLGARIEHTWSRSANSRVSTLDLLGSGLTLLMGPQRGEWRAAAAGLPATPPLVVESLDAINARAIGIRAGGALLVRPDGVPASQFSDDTDAAPALRAAV